MEHTKNKLIIACFNPYSNGSSFFISSYYDEVSWSDNKRILNYNAFPSKELAQKAVNLSKLGRLILLWQYANDCIFYPDWKNKHSRKYYIEYDHIGNVIDYYYNIECQLDNVCFETEEQAKAFVNMYNKELIRLMSVK